MTGLVGRPAREIAARVRAGEVTAVDVVRDHLNHVAKTNPGLNALPVVLAEAALGEAAEVDRRVAAGEPAGPLAGVPVSVKINVDVVGSATSSGVAALAGQVPGRDAPVVERLRAAGAVVLARGNMPDFGMRWHSDSGAHGATVNPWDATLSPGGSSGGEAVALATGMSALGLGNDYGGSLRLPSLAAGTLALKPTTGVVPTASDLPPLDPSPTLQMFGVQGPMARTVDDLVVAFDVLRGRHPRDPLSVDADLRERPGPVPVALVVDPGGLGVDGEVVAGVHRAADALRVAGHEVHEVDPAVVVDSARLWLSLVVTDLQVTLADVLRQIGSPGAVAFLDDFLALADVLDRDGHVTALVERHALGRAWADLTGSYPVVLGPVATNGTFAVGRDLSGPDAVREMWVSHRLLVAANLLGVPAVALPTGLDGRGLPTGAQLVGAAYGELDLLAAARAIERAHPHIAAPLPPRPTRRPARSRR
jgi:amidase